MPVFTAKFEKSSSLFSQCPSPGKPEYAFIGRSNVGKSSLINMITNHKSLAKTSGKPGKTQLINHFLINDNWYLVDLPGYGYAKVAKKQRSNWSEFTNEYLLKRTSLMCVFVLIDSRIPPQKIDLEFMEWLGTNGIAFIICFTKLDKLSKTQADKNITDYKEELLKTWEALPPCINTSAVKQTGKEEIIQLIEDTNKLFKKE